MKIHNTAILIISTTHNTKSGTRYANQMSVLMTASIVMEVLDL